IGTPGRLLDLNSRKVLDLSQFKTLVLDEFDRMLDMGFVHDVKRIIGSMDQRKQTMLFSATLDRTQKDLIGNILENPITVKVSQGNSTGDNIDQDIIKISNGEDKFKVLLNMVSSEEYDRVLLFEETKHKASRLCKKLNNAGISSDQIHGNKSQNARQRALNSFKQGEIKVLVATDVAARGIDVSDISHVINYQVPMTFDSYIHRIGRTGRAGKTGKAYTFVD
ncbi:MAG: ATP-dependent helicase, partial [Bacteroidetes bacterium]